jgi:tRNA pseudouridine38-40 synthase
MTMEPPPTGGSAAPEQHRLRLDLAYDGAPFRGFAENAGVRTVAGDLRVALERFLGQPVSLTCAGRTDAGVHARGQVVTFDVVGPSPDPLRLRDAVNAMVGPAVVVRGARTVEDDLDARFSARWRRYRYLVLNAEVPDPFLAASSWWVRESLDVEEMNRAATAFVGEHDFSSFCRRPRTETEVSLVRRVHAAGWTVDPGADTAGLVRFEIAASAFCHQMVRSIVGTLVRVGRGRMTPEQAVELLAARDRAGAPNLAPPHGLTLWEVGYEPWPDEAGAATTPPG